jgi:hypothetical protein
VSRGPGGVQRIIEKAFAAKPYHRWSVYQLCLLAFHGAELAPTGSEAILLVPCQSTRVSENERRSLLRAATKVARRRGWQIICDSTWKDTADPDQGKHIGRHVRFQNQRADAQAARVQRMRRSARLLKGLPLDPTPEELAAEAKQREAAAAKRAEHEIKVARVKAALGKELWAELQRLRGVKEAAEKTIEKTMVEMQIALMRGNGLNNTAARVLQDAGGDLDKALEMVADRMIDEDAA